MRSLDGAVAVITGSSRGIGHAIAMDVLVNNAAINIDRTMKNLSPVDWDTVIKADLSSYFYTVRATIPHFIQQKSGKIINISSMNNVTVNAICPAYVATEMYEAILARLPLGRAGAPQEVARAVHYLVVDGDYDTGETLNMNGGAYMQ